VASNRTFRQLRFVRPPASCELILVRHGESEPARENASFPLVDGQGDPALSPEGEEQASRVCERLGGEAIDAVYVTTLRRTVQTAAALTAQLGLEPRVERDLREVHLGDWEGGVYRQKVLEGDPIALAMAREQRFDVIPNAEPRSAFSKRVRAAVERIAVAHPDERVAVFTHGGVIGEILSLATGARPFAFLGADNASISHVVVNGDEWVLRRFNDTSHLEHELTARPEPLS